MIPDLCPRGQCGIYSSICPAEIDMRKQTWIVEPINDSQYLNWVEYIECCLRGVLRLRLSELYSKTQIPGMRAFPREGIQMVANGFA